MSLAYSWATSIMAGLVVLPVYLLGWVSHMDALMYFMVLDGLLYSPKLLLDISEFLSSD